MHTYKALTHPKRLRPAGGMTLVEVLIAMVISVMVLTGVLSMMMLTARQQRLGYVQQRVFSHADRVQDRISQYLKEGSRDLGVNATDADGVFYKRISFFDKRTDLGGTRREMIFNDTAKTLTYDPDMSTSGDEIELGMDSQGGDAISVLESVRFRMGMKAGGIPDSSVVMVTIRVSDRGWARKSYKNTNADIDVVRTFAVNLRRI